AGSTVFAAAEDVPRKMVMRTVITKSAGIRFWKQSVDSTDEQVDRLIVEQQRCHGERRERLVSGVPRCPLAKKRCPGFTCRSSSSSIAVIPRGSRDGWPERHFAGGVSAAAGR